MSKKNGNSDSKKFPEIIVATSGPSEEKRGFEKSLTNNGSNSGDKVDESHLFAIKQEMEAARTELEKISLAREQAKRESEAIWSGIHTELARIKSEWDNIAASRTKMREYSAEIDKKAADVQRERQELENWRDDQQSRLAAEFASEKARRLQNIKDELARMREEMLAQMEQERQTDKAKWQTFEEKRRDDAINALDRELEEKRERAEDEIRAKYAQLQSDMAEYEKRDAERREKELLLADQEADLSIREKGLATRQKQLDDAVERISGEKIRDLRAELELVRNQAAEQREHIVAARDLLGKYELLKQELGDRSPAEVLETIKIQYEELAGLHERLHNEPSEAARAMRERMEQEVRIYREEAEELRSRLDSLANVEGDLLSVKADLEDVITEKERIEQKFALLQGHNSELEKEIERYRNAIGTARDKAERIAKIEEFTYADIPMDGESISYLQPDNPETGEYDEIKWLDSIEKKCAEYRFSFPRRLLYAFHTALKVAEWSPITVLAGVSGTGKSELPRLFSLFGGINFLSLPVQPNWDSQDDLLGYYNVIDNYFAAQPVLRLLAQTQKDSSQHRLGLKDAMTIILLDEMNLAHIELYFAQFLSKFELRRGLKDMLPKIDINLGSDMTYQLPLDRNVLWVGTMNQDETTKSLSDKVLDRGIMLHFPRPQNLKRREKLSRLPSFPDKLLPRKAWAQWVKFKSPFMPGEIEPFKNFVEDINRHLVITGRALGHRVWQSMEYYMANYPTVRWRLDRYEKAKKENESANGRVFGDEKELREAMRTAFEDQLVQKVMPKLRGIETGGSTGTECLNKIESMLTEQAYDIVDDFRNACRVGYGQFIWNSADYLANEPALPKEYVEETEKAGGND